MPARRAAAWSVLVLLLCAAGSMAQEDIVSAGGKWVRGPYVDTPSGKHYMRFSLEADDAEMGRHPLISIICTGTGQPFLVAYKADMRLVAEFKDPLNYDTLATNAWVRIDEGKAHKVGWDLLPDGRSAIIDSKTAKALLTGTRLRVRMRDLVDTYTLGGLDPQAVEKACGNKWYELPPTHNK